MSTGDLGGPPPLQHPRLGTPHLSSPVPALHPHLTCAYSVTALMNWLSCFSVAGTWPRPHLPPEPVFGTGWQQWPHTQKGRADLAHTHGASFRACLFSSTVSPGCWPRATASIWWPLAQHSCGRRGPLLCAAGSLCWGDLRFVESEQGQGDTPHSSGDPRSVHRWLLTVSCVTPQKAR